MACMGGIVVTALLWSLAGTIAVAIGSYDTMPGWFQLGSGLGIVVVIGMVAGRRSGAI